MALIAGGVGITPIRSLVESMIGDLVLVYRVVHHNEIIFRDELERLAGDRGIRLAFVAGDHRAPDGKRLLTAEHLRELIPDLPEREVYVCGPPATSRMVETNVRRAGVPRKYLHSENFAL